MNFSNQQIVIDFAKTFDKFTHMTFQKPHLSKTIQYFSMKKFKAC